MWCGVSLVDVGPVVAVQAGHISQSVTITTWSIEVGSRGKNRSYECLYVLPNLYVRLIVIQLVQALICALICAPKIACALVCASIAVVNVSNCFY